MANTARLLDLVITQCDLNRWKWSVVHQAAVIACGYQNTKEAAQNDGDSALFALVSVART